MFFNLKLNRQAARAPICACLGRSLGLRGRSPSRISGPLGERSLPGELPLLGHRPEALGRDALVRHDAEEFTGRHSGVSRFLGRQDTLTEPGRMASGWPGCLPVHMGAGTARTASCATGRRAGRICRGPGCLRRWERTPGSRSRNRPGTTRLCLGACTSHRPTRI